MKVFTLLLGFTVAFVFANNLGVVRAPKITAQIEPIQPIELQEPLECINTGVSTTPPWLLYRDPPWSTSVQIPDIYDQPDQCLSMAQDALGRLYVVYETPYSLSPLLYGWGIATSTDQGLTWDNRVYSVSNYTMRYPEISITTNGKIYIFGTLAGTGIDSTVAFMRSAGRVSAYNHPDSLAPNVNYFGALVRRVYPECVTHGPGNGLCVVQYTIDRAGTANDSVQVLFTRDTVNWYSLRFRPSGGAPGMTSIGLTIGPADPIPDTILIHAVEYFDATGNDYDVVCYLDTFSIWRLWGWATGNTLNDRYPSVFCSQNCAYIAIQSEVASGNNDILFNYSTDYGASWNGTLIDITNDPINETYPRLHGFSTTIGCNYIYNSNTVRHNFSVLNGQDGTWQPTPEIVTDNASANNSYHSTALLWTPAYFHSVWEDTRNQGTDGIEIYASRRDAPIGISESNIRKFGKLRLYPNPFKDRVTIDLNPELKGKNLTLNVYDLTGKLIAANSINVNTTSIAWDATDKQGRKLPAGIYVLRITDGNIMISQKAILLQ